MSAPSGNLFSYRGRLLRKVAVHGRDVLAVSDVAFYLMTEKKVYRRDTLAHLIRDKKTRNTEFVSALVERLKGLELSLLAAAINALYSESLAGKLFTEATKVMSLDELVKYIVEYGEQVSGLYRSVSGCRVPVKDEPPPTIVFTPFVGAIKLLEALGINFGFGVYDGVPCVVIDEKNGIGVALAAEEQQ